jgi:outer membrane lipoprotein
MMRAKYTWLVPFLAGAMVLSTGCARTFPQRITDQVDKSITFDDLSKNPDTYKGKWVMFAGVIAASKTEKDGSSYIEIVQKPAESGGRPLRTDQTGGRFIAVSKQFLDPAIYARGREITVVGEVAGMSVRPLGEIAYRYPLLTVEALHLWEPYHGPSFGIGVGVGVFHRY